MKLKNALFLLIKAAFGGLVGLCVGFSVISLLEVVYWFTVRLWIDRIRVKKKKENAASKAKI